MSANGHVPMMPTVPDRAYTDAEVDAAVEALTDPDRLRAAQDLVAARRAADPARARPSPGGGRLVRHAHEQAVVQAAELPDVEERITALRTLLAEETRVGMFVGVAVGFGLARELSNITTTEDP